MSSSIDLASLTLLEEAKEPRTLSLEVCGLFRVLEIPPVFAPNGTSGSGNDGKGGTSCSDATRPPVVADEEATGLLDGEAGCGPNGAKKPLGIRALGKPCRLFGS
jgi:hypothetical protein